ncbi:MAG: YihY/virulence factor BrkB family protein, partial [Halobacteriales archaeon]|nr:YihY/virulence factor BrkB family protein [Halobacteriales archaeon]
IGAVLLLWGAIKVVRGLSRAIARVYGTRTDGSLLETVGKAVLTLGVGGIAAGLTVATASLIRTLAGPVGALASLGLPIVLIATFVPLYVLLPDVPVTVREAVPGALVAAVGWTLLGTAFGLYTAVVGSTVYGVLGAVLLLVTWLYLGAFILIVGATVNAVLAGRKSVDRA